MKNLFYKEMKLAMHPVIWVFIILFPFLILIPSYPTFIGSIYVCSAYPILFLGANKGQQSNDIYFSCLLPIKKRDVVKARMMTVLFLQIVYFLISMALVPLAIYLRQGAVNQYFNEQILINPGMTMEMAEAALSVGLGPKAEIATVGFSLAAFTIFDLIYFGFFYKNGRSIVLPTLLGMLVFCLILFVPTIILPSLFEGFKTFFEGNILNQLMVLGIGIVISAVGHYLVFSLAANEFEKVDL